jgi:hypothetical protein
VKERGNGLEAWRRLMKEYRPRVAGQRDINSCSKKTLLKVDGIGVTLAARIMDARPFEFWNDVAKLLYIGMTRLATLKRNLTLDAEVVYGYRVNAEPGHYGYRGVAAEVSPEARTPVSGKSMYGKVLLRRMFVGWMLLLSSVPMTDSFDRFAVCCDRHQNWCEHWKILKEVCLERVARRSPLYGGKAEKQKVRGIFASIVEESDIEMKIVDEPMMTT